MFKINDTVKVIKGLYQGKTGKVITLPPAHSPSQLVVVKPESGRAFACPVVELEKGVCDERQ